MRICIPVGDAVAQSMSAGDDAVRRRPDLLLPELRWWREQGVEGVVLYDSPAANPLPFLGGGWEAPDEGFLRELKAVFDEASLAVPVVHCLRKSLFVEELAASDERKMRDAAAIGRRFGASLVDLSVNVPLPGQYPPLPPSDPSRENYPRGQFRGDAAPPGSFERSAGVLKRFARDLAEWGMGISLELHHDGLQDTADNCLKLWRLVDEPNVGFNPDIGNSHGLATWHNPEGPRATLEKLAPRTNYAEVKNYKRLWIHGEARYYPVPSPADDGDLDFREAVEILVDAGFDGWVCDEGARGDLVYSHLRFIRYLRWIVEEWLPARQRFAHRLEDRTSRR